MPSAHRLVNADVRADLPLMLGQGMGGGGDKTAVLLVDGSVTVDRY